MRPAPLVTMTPSCIPSTFSAVSHCLLPRSPFLTLTLPLNPHLRHRFLHKPRFPPTTPTPLLRSPTPLSYSTAAAGASSSSSSHVHFEDIIEKDWSFLDFDPTSSSDQERFHKAHRIISAAEVRRDSRVLVSMGASGFVDHLVDSFPCELLLAIHDSLFVLAMVKEKHDNVRCWQGGIDAVPEKFAPFDAVFLCYLPGMAVSLDQILSLLAARCSPGARLVISFDQGRDVIEQHRQQYPDMVTSDLPDRTALEKAASDHSFQITEFVDEPSFYLAVLRFEP